MSRILMVASEATPFAKTGGLADVLGALPAALTQGGDQVAVIVPRYGHIPLDDASRVFNDLPVYLGTKRYDATLYGVQRNDVPYYLLDIPELYDRPGLYGGPDGDYPDNHIRFGALSKAAISVARYLFRPDIFHAHDWQAGLVPIFLRHSLATDPTFVGIKVVFTIHNLGYQGIFPPSALDDLGLDRSLLTSGVLEYYGNISLLKGAILLSDAVTTVSKGYAREIQGPELGFGMDGLLRSRASVLHGILQGADYSDWDPAHDQYIAANYTADDLSGKSVCKQDLLREFGLPEVPGRPVIGIVSRFVNQKGFDLIAAVADELAHEDLSLAVLGSGEPQYEALFQRLASTYPDKVAVRIGYDIPLSHKIEAGADMFLMPSHYEPCGLNQIYSLRYGTVPIVRATGGLDDTIDEGTGFKFYEYSPGALLGATRAALSAFRDPASWRERMRMGMRKDFSWAASAAEYSLLYHSLRGS
jgi:starch synthase